MNDQIRNRLFDYEVNPPESVWNGINDSLDLNGHSFPDRLYRFEQKPPDKVWDRIVNSLQHSDSSTPVVPFYKRQQRIWKYAGAAVIVSILVFLGSRLTNQRSGNNTADQNFTQAPQPAVRDDTSGNGEPTQPSVAKTAENNRNQETKKYPARRREEGINMFSYMDATAPRETAAGNLQEDKYMIFIDGDGNATRLSRKLLNAFACAAYDYACRERINALQARVASTAVTTDFTGILDILRNLQENQ